MYTNTAVPRDIKKTNSILAWNQIDEVNAFLRLDKTNCTNLKESLINDKKDFVCPVLAFLDKNNLTVQSSKILMVSFSLRIYLKICDFKPFIMKLCVILATFLKTHINTVDTWSRLEESIQIFKFCGFWVFTF